MQPSNLGDLHCHKPWHYSANDVSASHHGWRKQGIAKASFKKKGTPRTKEWWKLAQMVQMFSSAFINWNACFTPPCLWAKLHGVTWSEHACIDQSNDCKGKLPSINLISWTMQFRCINPSSIYRSLQSRFWSYLRLLDQDPWTPKSEPKQPCGNFGFAPFLKEFRFPLMGFRTFGRGIDECTWQETQGKGWYGSGTKII